MLGASRRTGASRLPVKPTVLALAEVYLPGYLAGGPVRSLAGLVEALGDEFDWKIVTTDRDFRTKQPYPDVQADCWTRVGKATVWYASPASLRSGAQCRLLRETRSDLIYFNSFFSPRFSILPMIASRLALLDSRPILIAPRGEFSPGAFRLKRWKKASYIKLARAAVIYRNVFWHATAETERENIMRTLGVAADRISVAPNLASPVAAIQRVPRPAGSPLRVCFLSRISRMKNLDLALNALARVTAPVIFTVYGPIEDSDYWSGCLQLAERLPKHVAFQYKGPVPHEHVHAELVKHDLFFLPTRGENFGHALIEAWSAGLPVLTSDQTPWRELEAKGVGWDMPLSDVAAYGRTIDGVAAWSPARAEADRERCKEFAALVVGNRDDIARSRSMFYALAQVGGDIHGRI